MAPYCFGELSLSCLQSPPGLPTDLPVRLGPRFTSVAAQAVPACLPLPKAALPPPQYMLFLLPGELFSICCYLTAPAYPQTSVQVSSNPISLSSSGPLPGSTTDLPITAESWCMVSLWLFGQCLSPPCEQGPCLLLLTLVSPMSGTLPGAEQEPHQYL